VIGIVGIRTSQGHSEEEALENIQDAIQEYLEGEKREVVVQR